MQKYLTLANGTEARLVDSEIISELYETKKVNFLGDCKLEGQFYAMYESKIHSRIFYAVEIMQAHSMKDENKVLYADTDSIIFHNKVKVKEFMYRNTQMVQQDIEMLFALYPNGQVKFCIRKYSSTFNEVGDIWEPCKEVHQEAFYCGHYTIN